jgi:hypothetical protein
MRKYTIELRRQDDGKWIAELLNSGGGWLETRTGWWPEAAALKVAETIPN